jgi:hypothetical protein
MQKQVPFLARERAEKLVEYLSKALVQSDNYDSKRAIVLNSIEDKSFVVPNRETFLMYLSKMLHKEFGMGIRIENYVIR